MPQMEVKEAERMVIAKPVASRPTCSGFKSFSELLAAAIDASPPAPNACSQNAVPAIRPKTVRFKPMENLAPPSEVSSSSDKVSKSDVKPTVVYKPQAKLVSKATVSLLANMENFSANNQLTMQSTVEPDQVSPNLHCNTETDQTSEHSKVSASQNMEEDPRIIPAAAANADRPSYDGYNWRKYGQKQVKGSEYPRSYYKCTHPNCPVKKKVERSFDGQIAEIVYKGEHNHSKTQPPKRYLSGSQALGFTPGGSEGPAENQNEGGLSAPQSYHGKALLPYEHVNAGGVSENSIGVSGECEEGSKEEEDDQEPRSKRRKSENQSSETGTSVKGIQVQEPRVIMQSSNESEIMGDGFRWRKYGQKAVKGNLYPRSYYRCTTPNCNVRKHVERVSDDPRALITTYEGKHNHDMPLRNTNTVASDPDSNSPAGKDK